jgi:hypothetical protein
MTAWNIEIILGGLVEGKVIRWGDFRTRARLGGGRRQHHELAVRREPRRGPPRRVAARLRP